MNQRNKNKGITLIALVITIIILLILAGITIGQLTGNGLFDKVKLAKEKWDEATGKENATLGEYENYIENSRDMVTIPKDVYESLLQKTTSVRNISASEFWKTTTDYININENIKVIKEGNLIEYELIAGSIERGAKKHLPNGIEVQIGILNEEFCPELDRVIEYGIDGGDVNRATFAIYKDGKVTVKNNRGSESAAIGHFFYSIKQK